MVKTGWQRTVLLMPAKRGWTPKVALRRSVSPTRKAVSPVESGRKNPSREIRGGYQDGEGRNSISKVAGDIFSEISILRGRVQ